MCVCVWDVCLYWNGSETQTERFCSFLVCCFLSSRVESQSRQSAVSRSFTFWFWVISVNTLINKCQEIILSALVVLTADLWSCQPVQTILMSLIMMSCLNRVKHDDVIDQLHFLLWFISWCYINRLMVCVCVCVEERQHDVTSNKHCWVFVQTPDSSEYNDRWCHHIYILWCLLEWIDSWLWTFVSTSYKTIQA